jgi:hypothetical protein
MKRVVESLGILAVLCACQNYAFREVKPLPLAVVNEHDVIGATRGTPYLMIVQDTSDSMCEPINRDAGLVTDRDAGGFNYCAADPMQSKMGLTSAAMQSVLGSLDPTKNPFYLALTSFPGPALGCDVVTGPAIPFGTRGAAVTLPQVVSWYQGIVGREGGGTPTSATLAQVALDPTFQSLDGGEGKYLLLITDGLPNCNNMNPCVYGSGQQYLWSDGVQRGCMSPTWLQAIGGGNATPPSACVCAAGACVAPNPADSTTYALTCCIVDWTVQDADGGYPNAPIAADQCIDGDGTVAAIKALRAQGITTYVVGMGYDYTNAAVLDQMAQAGQNDPNATHYQADNPADLTAALQQLITSIAVSCIYPLDRTPQDPRLVEVTLDGMALGLGDANGFSYTTPGGTPTITILGTACKTIKDGMNHDLTITALAD